MSSKIDFNVFHFLLRVLDYIADKSENWQMFVRPEILVGLVFFWIGLTSFGPKQKKRPTDPYSTSEKKDSIKLHSGICVAIDESESHDINIGPVDTATYIINAVEQMPQYPGGESELLNFVGKNLRYPESAVNHKIQGKVIVRFVVTETGEVDKIEVIRSLQAECDKEAIRVIKLFPKFIPGKQNGKNTKVWYTFPVTFKLEK